MNRIVNGIAKMRAQIRRRIEQGLTTPERVEVARKDLDMDLGEFCRFQELKSLAVMDGRLTLEEGQSIFSLLGGTPDHFNGLDVAAKRVLTEVFMELLGKEVARG